MKWGQEIIPNDNYPNRKVYVTFNSPPINKKILMTPPPFPTPPFLSLSRSLEVVWMSSESYSSSFVLSSFCLSVVLNFCYI